MNIVIYGYNFYPKNFCEAESKKSGLALYNTFQVYGLMDWYGVDVTFIRSHYGTKQYLHNEVIDGVNVFNMPVKFSDYFEENGAFNANTCYNYYHDNIELTNYIYAELCGNLEKIVGSLDDNTIILNTHNFIPTVVAILLKKKYPTKNIVIYATIHDIDTVLADFVKNNYSFVNWIISISNSVKGRLLNIGFSNKNIALIHNGIDVNKIQKNLSYCNENETWRNICHRNQVDTLSYIVTLPGRRVPHKGHIVAFKALKLLISKQINIQLLITGKGMGRDEYEITLTQAISDLGIVNHVKFLDEIKSEEMMSLYYNSDLIITPSTEEEGFCYANIECMLVGKAPVITSGFGGVLDYIEHRQTGCLFPVNDYIALAEEMEFILSNKNLHADIIQNAKITAQKFDVRHMIESYIKLFTKL